MVTGDPGDPGVNVLVHVEEESSLPIVTAITQHPGIMGDTAQEKEPFTDPAVLSLAHLMV